jgi:Outer membrane protein beta-barrel domain
MKKTVIALITALLFLTSVSAQKPSVGIASGVSVANYKVKEDGNDESDKTRAGIMAGLIANFPAGKSFMIQTGANWIQKGTQESDGTDKGSITVNTIEVPVNFLYNSKGFFIGAGPSVAFAVSGKAKANDVSVKLHFGKGDDDVMKRFDFGASIQSGYQSPGGFLVMANFNQGISNLAPGGSSNATLRSHYFGIRIGYVLKGKKA